MSFAASPAAVNVDLTAGRAAGEGADVLVGIDGVVGSRFNDVVTGNGGRNTLSGGDGNDSLSGRAATMR